MKVNFVYSDGIDRYEANAENEVDFDISVKVSDKRVTDADFKSITEHAEAIKGIVKKYIIPKKKEE